MSIVIKDVVAAGMMIMGVLEPGKKQTNPPTDFFVKQTSSLQRSYEKSIKYFRAKLERRIIFISFPCLK